MKYKLVCFDLDGTIIDETIYIWQTIHDHLRTDNEKRALASKKFYNNKISYEEWAKHDIELWKEAGATKKEILDALKGLKLMNGAKEALEKLKENGITLAIVSGSLNIALEKVLPNYKDYFKYCFINNIFFDNKDHISGIKSTLYDFGNKADALKAIVKKEGISLEETAFIGDNENDVSIAELAGLSIAFNCKSENLKKASDVVVEEKDLRKILPFILS